MNLLIAGCNAKDGAELYWIDHLSALQKIPFAAHGYAAYFVMSLMDRHYRRGLTLEEAKELMKMCFRELKTRFIVHFPKFIVKVITKDGVQEIELGI